MGYHEKAAFAAGFLVGAGELTLPECKLPGHVISLKHDYIELGKQEGRLQRAKAATGSGIKGFREQIQRNKDFLGLEGAEIQTTP